MTGSVEGAKDIAAEAAKDAGEAKPSPGELLKKAVAGTTEKAPAPALSASLRRMPKLRLDTGTMAAATVALVVGTGFGLATAPRERSIDALTRIDAGFEAGRTESARLNGEVERLATTLAAIRESSEASRSEAKALAAGLTDRLTRLEQGLDRKVSALGEKIDQAEREHGARIAGLSAEKRAAAPAVVPAATSAAAPPAGKPEPTQTASIGDAKQKSETVEAWALRDVFDGVAILEDRRRRLVEVGPGDSIPGVGRVEAIERRGRNWVVVTRQGLITPQMW